MHRNLLAGRLRAQAGALCTECRSVVLKLAVSRPAPSCRLPLPRTFSTHCQRRSTAINKLVNSHPPRQFQQSQLWRAFSTTVESSLNASDLASLASASFSVDENETSDNREDKVDESDMDDLDILKSGKLPPAPPAIQKLRDRYIATKESNDPRDKQALLEMYQSVARDRELLLQLYPVDFTQALYAAKALNSLPAMRRIVDVDVGKTSHRRHPSFYHIMLRAYMVRHDYVQADKIWKMMKHRKVELTQASYHIMLHLCKDRRNTHHALRLLQQMDESGISVDQYTYVLLLGICYRRGNAQLGQQLFDEMPGRGLDWTPYHYSTLLGIYVKAGDRAGAFRVLDEMQDSGFVPNTVIFNSLLSVIDDPTEREQFFDEFLEQGLQPNLHTLLAMRTPLSDILERLDQDDADGKGDHDRLEVTRDDFNLLLRRALKGSRTGLLSHILASMRRRQFQPDVFTFSTLMDAFVKTHQYAQARDIFEGIMASDTIVPDVVVYTNGIGAALGESDTIGALQILKRMIDDGLMPNAVTMNQLLTTMVNSGGTPLDINGISHSKKQEQQQQLAAAKDSIEMAELIIDLMRANGIREDIRSFNILLAAYARANEAEKMMATFHRMKHKSYVSPDILTYETLILGHLRSGNLRFAVDTYFAMRDRDMYGHSAVHNQLLSALIASGQANQTLQLWRDLSRSGRRRDDQSFRIMLDACDRFGLLEQRHEIENEWEEWKKDDSAAASSVDDMGLSNKSTWRQT